MWRDYRPKRPFLHMLSCTFQLTLHCHEQKYYVRGHGPLQRIFFCIISPCLLSCHLGQVSTVKEILYLSGTARLKVKKAMQVGSWCLCYSVTVCTGAKHPYTVWGVFHRVLVVGLIWHQWRSEEEESRRGHCSAILAGGEGQVIWLCSLFSGTSQDTRCSQSLIKNRNIHERKSRRRIDRDNSAWWNWKWGTAENHLDCCMYDCFKPQLTLWQGAPYFASPNKQSIQNHLWHEIVTRESQFLA